MMRDLPVHLLHQVLTYDPETGSLRWKVRPVEMFAHCKNPKRACAIWNAKYAGKEAGTDFDGYTIIGFKAFGAGMILAHRVAWAMHYGTWPDLLDHENHDRKANWISNLREATRQQNQQNLPLMAHNTSGAAGVSWDKQRGLWKAYLGSSGKQTFLGRFHTKEAAIGARARAATAAGFHPNHGL